MPTFDIFLENADFKSVKCGLLKNFKGQFFYDFFFKGKVDKILKTPASHVPTKAFLTYHSQL